MAASPQWKVYDKHGAYQAACKEPEAAVVLAEWYGDGAVIRVGHRHVVWTVGADRYDGFDDAVKKILAYHADAMAKTFRRVYGQDTPTSGAGQ
jgi:hypothetical protein